jgi:hypothetical protein
MALLHDAQYKADVLRRVEALRPDTRGRWGRMSVSQMLWHVSEALDGALGRTDPTPEQVPLPRPLMKFIVINLPWPKGAPTLKRWEARNDNYDFAAERARCVRLIHELTSKSLDSAWPDSPSLGRMTGKDVSRLQAKHLNHHLTQFGV